MLHHNSTSHIALQQLHFNNSIALQKMWCKNCTASMELQQLYCSNCTAAIALQQCNCNICTATMQCNAMDQQQWHCNIGTLTVLALHNALHVYRTTVAHTQRQQYMAERTHVLRCAMAIFHFRFVN